MAEKLITLTNLATFKSHLDSLLAEKLSADCLHLSTTSGTLTSSQLAYVNTDNAVILYNNEFYYKDRIVNGTAYFRKILIQSGDVSGKHNISYGGEFGVNTTTGAYLYTSSNTSSVYNATQADARFAHSLEMSVNTSTYVLTATLKDGNGTALSTETVDLPIESMVVNGTYNSSTKKVELTLQSGSTIEFSVADLISGLVNSSTLDSYYTKTEVDSKIAGFIDVFEDTTDPSTAKNLAYLYSKFGDKPFIYHANTSDKYYLVKLKSVNSQFSYEIEDLISDGRWCQTNSSNSGSTTFSSIVANPSSDRYLTLATWSAYLNNYLTVEGNPIFENTGSSLILDFNEHHLPIFFNLYDNDTKIATFRLLGNQYVSETEGYSITGDYRGGSNQYTRITITKSSGSFTQPEVKDVAWIIVDDNFSVSDLTPVATTADINALFS